MSGTYEPPISPQGTGHLLDPTDPPMLAPGIIGRAFLVGPLVAISSIGVNTRETPETFGSLARFVDSLSDRCVFASITNPEFRRFLKRRGYQSQICGWEDGRNPGIRQRIWMRPAALAVMHAHGMKP